MAQPNALSAPLATSPFRFNDLHPELRNTIHKLFLVSSKPILIRYGRELDDRCKIRGYTIKQIPLYKNFEFSHSFPGAMNHLLVNSQFYAEAIGILYGSNTFLIEYAGPFKKFLQVINNGLEKGGAKKFRDYVSDVRLLYQNSNALKGCPLLMDDLPSLQKLRIGLTVDLSPDNISWAQHIKPSLGQFLKTFVGRGPNPYARRKRFDAIEIRQEQLAGNNKGKGKIRTEEWEASTEGDKTLAEIEANLVSDWTLGPKNIKPHVSIRERLTNETPTFRFA